ncbi:uncharacterized protein N7446_010606 [Penicillium canescens]|uniref:Uncharacterized protein n=1 Tax=Penicillium canescens TaxID=5083 RepID=A0AAD6IBN0_PENCN|nr:uncharacterized protein N7446_010606 [Penicillium canescens]KAJ6041510.1 hypothetical protein N7460_006900 [Penicillium canescens]KAJ6050497.1 hypothetical protein N7446_010606 [Penicillium canescens]KAJ6064798.1 hypothetical protein N7444_000451 [Penicillium canescens]
MAQQNFQTCLGVPIPESLRRLTGAPPACLPISGDVAAVEITGSLGEGFSKPRDEIMQAQHLTTGFSDIIIILERPLDRQNHKFNCSSEDFVKSSKTLSAVDELIRFASKGARSIHTVTVLNAFPFQPDKFATGRERKGHEALARILQAKKPKVILRCHREEYSDEWLKRIELPGRDYRLGRKEINITEDHAAVVLQSFHPSCAVNNADCRPEYRALLMYHFVAAFSELWSEFSLPDTAEMIRMLCLQKGERMWHDVPNYKPWQAAFRISEALEKAYDGPCKAHFLRISDETPLEHCSTRIKGFNAMCKSLNQLFGNSNNFGCLGIAKVVLFLWEQHFRDDPLYEQTKSWLLLRGNEQKDWFSSGPHPAPYQSPLEDDFSGLRISERPLLCGNQKLTDELRLLADEASESLGSAEYLGERLRANMVRIFEEHNVLVRKYLSGTSTSDINNAMRIRAQLNSCEVFLSTFIDQNVSLEQTDMLDLVRLHKELASLVAANSAG